MLSSSSRLTVCLCRSLVVVSIMVGQRLILVLQAKVYAKDIGIQKIGILGCRMRTCPRNYAKALHCPSDQVAGKQRFRSD